VFARAAYGRAAAALVAGIEECEEHRGLMELQKVALVKNMIMHFQGLEVELQCLITSAESFESALAEVLARSPHPRPAEPE